MYIAGYSAWITIPGHELREFDVAVDQYNRKVTCWIPSEEGMNFSVHWKDHGWTIPTATFIKLDGYTVPGHFLMGQGEAERSSIRVGISTVRPFTFTKVPENHATPTDTNPAELGTIIVKIKRVAIVGKHKANSPITPRLPIGGRHLTDEAPVGIGFGGEEMGHCQMPTTWKVKPWDKQNPGTYVTFIFRHRSRKFLISQGIMSESDDIYTSVHAHSREDSASPGLEEEDSQYAESAPPSPTESSPPPTPTLSARSSSPRREPSVRPPRRPVSSRSFSLGEPPRPSSALPQTSPKSWTSKSPPAPLPHPIVPSHGREGEEGGLGARPPVRTTGRRVVSYDTAIAKAANAHAHRSSDTTSANANSGGARATATGYTSGAVSYYDITSQASSASSSYEPGTTDFNDVGPVDEFFNIASAEYYDPGVAYSYDDDANATYACNEDPNAYLSSGYPGATEIHRSSANNSYDSSADTSYDRSAGPFDPSNVIRSYDPHTVNTAHYYGHAPASSHPQEEETPEEASVLTLATASLKDAVFNFPEIPGAEADAQRPPKEKRPYSKTRPGPALYLGQGPYKDLAPKTQAASVGPARPESTQRASSVDAPTSTNSSRRSSVNQSKGAATRSRAKEAHVQSSEAEAFRAEQARQTAARFCTPSVPIPRNLVFVNADPTASRKSSESSRRQERR